jgi:hypothetical protein
VGDLVHFQADKKAHFHHAGQAFVDGGQFLQRFVHREDLLVAGRHRIGHAGVQGDQGLATATAVGTRFAHQVHHHRAHHAGGIGQEVATVLDLQLVQSHQAQVAFVHQGRGVQQGGATAEAQARVRNAAQIGIEQFIQPVHRRGLAGRCTFDELGDFTGVLHVWILPASWMAREWCGSAILVWLQRTRSTPRR